MDQHLRLGLVGIEIASQFFILDKKYISII